MVAIRPTILSLLNRGTASTSAVEGVGNSFGLTYEDLRASVRATAGVIQLSGVSSDNRIAIVMRNRPETAIVFLAAANAGASAPLNPSYGRGEFDFYLGDLGARLVLVDSDFDTPAREAAEARGIPVIDVGRQGPRGRGLVLNGIAAAEPFSAAAAPDSVALVLHTSGTTSRPKMVPLSHRNLLASAGNIVLTLALAPEDRSLTVMPLFHIHGLVAGLLAPLMAGGTVIVPPDFAASEFLGWLTSTGPTWYTAVPTMHQAILDRLAGDSRGTGRAHSTLRFVRSSSAALPPRTLRDLEAALGVPVIEAYGMTEAAHQMASNPLPPGVRKPGTVGPSAGPDVAIMDENGGQAATGQVGEIVIRGESVTSGYLANPEANVGAFTSGWFRTGDQGMIDNDGYLTLTGRLKELINRAGEKIAPLEVDAVLMEHPSVAQAICFGIPHPILGEEVAAAVVLKADQVLDARDLRAFVASRLAYYKVPRQIRLVPSIPVGATGKLQRRGLADLLGVVAEVPVISGDRTTPRTPLEEIVTATWTEILDREVGGVHENFFALGGDSILAIRTVARLRELLRVDLPLMSFFDAPTVAGNATELEPLLHSAPCQAG